MQFLCLAYGHEKDWLALTEERRSELLANDDVIRRRGNLVTAVREPVVVRAPDGTPSTASEPYAKSPAPLVGFSVIEAADIAEAVGLVAGTPCAVAGGAIEVRPFW
jgi:hypothetical protein